MTYLKTILATAAAVAIAAPAFAADNHQEKKHDPDMKVKATATMTDDNVAMMKKKQMDEMRKKHMESMSMDTKADMHMKTEGHMHIDGEMTTDMHPSKVNDTVGEILQADGEPSIQSDDDIIVEDYTIEDEEFRAADDDGMIADNAIVVPGSAGTITTVTCPAGTTAQPDMTCMITGEYEPDLDE
ncbi:hypothetical protein GCM10009069_22310 [Algimonas arctica]|uniref:Uncharacterized protein n=1 Tax=Algimonas arctica TaxID=1479486 RepID=A0A8J3G2Z4_9PROT|nr:hypothetical protein [Algimonas arctica]GHA98893.1 hypothetical protein GCM10009069_22310 [Algimonas arctica]